MKKLFIILTSLLILGICLPILAASTGEPWVKKNCKNEISNPLPGAEVKQGCKKKEEAKAEKASQSSEKKEEKDLSSKEKKKAESGKESPANPSFNFLYYLFYKSSINDYFQNSECQGPGMK